MKVCVLLSSYNGEKYIKEQIDSILSQEQVELDLYVRDDGSSDSTISIIEEYQKEHNNVYLERGKNVGPSNSFMELLYMTPGYDYYAFSDQDDIWLPQKIISAVKMIEKNVSIPCLYCSNQTLIDHEGKVIGKRFDSEPKHDLANMIASNHLSGCTMLLNAKLYEILVRKDVRPSEEFLKMRMHDTWTGLVADCTGKMIYDKNSYILYRQHNNNVVGAKEKGVFQKTIDLLKTFKGIGYIKIQRYTARQLSKSMKRINISDNDKYIIKQFNQLFSFGGRIKFCLNHSLIKVLKGNVKFIRLKVMIGMW